MAGHARIRRNQLRRRHRLDRDNRRERVGDRPHAAEVERVGLVLHVLRDDERHIEVIEIAGRVWAREIGDAEAGAQHRAGIAGQAVRQAQTRREVEIVRSLVGAAAGAVLPGVDQDETVVVEVGEPVVPFCRGVKDRTTQARIDGEPVADLEVVLHERRLLHHPEVRDLEQEPAARVVEIAEEHRGEAGAARVREWIHTVAFANFENRVTLALGVKVEPDGPVPPLAVKLDREHRAAVKAPPRPAWDAVTSAKPKKEYDAPADWKEVPYEKLEEHLAAQKERTARVPLPDRVSSRSSRRTSAGRPRRSCGPGQRRVPAGDDRRLVRHARRVPGRRRRWTGCSAAPCSGSSPGPTTASTEWATGTCCSRSRA